MRNCTYLYMYINERDIIAIKTSVCDLLTVIFMLIPHTTNIAPKDLCMFLSQEKRCSSFRSNSSKKNDIENEN